VIFLDEMMIDHETLRQVEIDIMVAINKSLYHKKILTLEVFEKANEIILRGEKNGFI